MYAGIVERDVRGRRAIHLIGRAGKKLHHAARAGRRNRLGAEAAFGARKGEHETRIDMITAGRRILRNREKPGQQLAAAGLRFARAQFEIGKIEPMRQRGKGTDVLLIDRREGARHFGLDVVRPADLPERDGAVRSGNAHHRGEASESSAGSLNSAGISPPSMRSASRP